MDTAYVYAEITKSEKLKDGTLLVRGIATSSALDIDQQICDPSWLKSAMPRWFRYGNIREQHSNIAAGVATEYSEKDGGVHEILARIVDPGSVIKVENKVLKGFSIGIRGPRIMTDTKAPGGRIVDGEIVEVSLVDRPANPECMLTLAKAATPGLEVTADRFDAEHQLVQVEELVEKTAAPDVSPASDAVPDDAPSGEGGAEVGGSSAPPDTTEKASEAHPLDVAEVEPSDPADDSEAGGQDAEKAVDHLPTPELVHLLAKALAVPVGEMVKMQLSLAGILKPGALGEGIDKRDFGAGERKQLAGDGRAMPGGGFPIKTIGDLKNAIQSIGRAKDPAAAKAHIKRRAEALGREDLIPDSWKGADGELLKAPGDDEMAHDAAVLQQVRDGLLALIIAEAQEAMKGEREEYDISCLTDALAMFLAWWDHEAYEGEVPGVSEVKSISTLGEATGNRTSHSHTLGEAHGNTTSTSTSLGEDSDAPSGDGPDDGRAPTSHDPTCSQCGAAVTSTPATPGEPPNRQGTPERDLPTPATPKAAEPAPQTTPDAPAPGETATPDSVKATIAEATRALRQELEETRARLAQVEKAAAPGGPVRVRTTAQHQVSRETEELRSRAASLKAVAKTVSAPDIRKEYERQAAMAEQQLRDLQTKTA